MSTPKLSSNQTGYTVDTDKPRVPLLLLQVVYKSFDGRFVIQRKNIFNIYYLLQREAKGLTSRVSRAWKSTSRATLKTLPRAFRLTLAGGEFQKRFVINLLSIS